MSTDRGLTIDQIERLLEYPWVADYFEDALDGGDRTARRRLAVLADATTWLHLSPLHPAAEPVLGRRGSRECALMRG